MPDEIMKTGVSLFANTRHKSVTIATSLERAVVIRIFYYDADLSVYIC